MPGGGNIEIGAVVDIGEFKAQMDAGADAVNAFTSKSVTSFTELETVSAANLKRISANTREVAQSIDSEFTRASRALLDYKAAQSEVAAATRLAVLARKEGATQAAQAELLLAAAEKTAGEAARELQIAEEQAGVGAQALASETNEATGSLALMGEEMGVRVNRHMRNFIADLPIVGELLNKAFAGFAIIGIIELLGMAYEKTIAITDKLGGYTEEVKKFDKEMEAANEKQLLGFKTVEEGQKVIQELNGRLGEQPSKWQAMTEASKDFTSTSTTGLIALLGPLYAVYKGYTLISGAIEDSSAQALKVAHEHNEAISRTQKIMMADEEHATRLSLETFKSGSTERIRILQDEIAKRKGFGDEWHDYVARLEDELIVAQREHAQQGIQLAKEALRQQVTDAKSTFSEILAAMQVGSLERVQILAAEDQKLRGMGKAYVEFEKQISKELIAAKREYLVKSEADQDAHDKAMMKLSEQGLEAVIKENGEKIKADEKYLRENTAMMAEMYDNARSAAQGWLKDHQADLDFEVAAGRISNEQKLRLLQQYTDQEYASERRSLSEKLSLYKEGSKEYEQTLKEQQKAEDTYRQRKLQLDRQLILEEKQLWHQFTLSIPQAFNNSINIMELSTKSFGQIATQIASQIGDAFISMSLQMAEKFIADRLRELIYGKAVAADKTATDLAAKAAQVASTMASNTAMATSDAGLAAAGTFAWWSSIFPPAAPAAAEAAYGIGMSFAGLAAFEKGGIVPSDQMAFVHKNEMVLPAAISQRLQTMTGQPGALPGGHVVNFHYSPRVSAVDAAGFEEVLNRHSDVAFKVFSRRLKKMGIGQS
jgi:hypothetical protein